MLLGEKIIITVSIYVHIEGRSLWAKWNAFALQLSALIFL